MSIWKSDATQAILFELDNECRKRFDVLKNITQWKLAVLFCKILKLYRSIESRENKSEFLLHMFSHHLTSITNSKYYISEMKREEFVLLMCMVRVLNFQNSGNVEKLHGLHDRLQMNTCYMTKMTLFEDMDAIELAICYSAMKKLNVSNIKILEAKLEEKYGFRF